MSDTSFPVDMMTQAAARRADRRRFMKNAGVAGVAGLGVLGASQMTATNVFAQSAPTDADVLNFALNLEYLEAEFYVRAAFGRGLAAGDTTGTGTPGGVTGGRAVSFATEAIRQYAVEIAADEEAHVRFLRAALGTAAVARPAINIESAFTAAARAAGLVGPTATFDAYANENNFLLAAFIFEDVGVTAYKGASPLISNRVFLEAAAGLLAVEAYHAGLLRTVLFARGLSAPVQAISNARDSLDGTNDLDQGILDGNRSANIVPTDASGLAFSRTANQVLNIVYLTPQAATSGGFFPQGVNGTLNTSGSPAQNG
jgi:hypothetical protein